MFKLAVRAHARPFCNLVRKGFVRPVGQAFPLQPAAVSQQRLDMACREISAGLLLTYKSAAHC